MTPVASFGSRNLSACMAQTQTLSHWCCMQTACQEGRTRRNMPSKQQVAAPGGRPNRALAFPSLLAEQPRWLLSDQRRGYNGGEPFLSAQRRKGQNPHVEEQHVEERPA